MSHWQSRKHVYVLIMINLIKKLFVKLTFNHKKEEITNITNMYMVNCSIGTPMTTGRIGNQDFEENNQHQIPLLTSSQGQESIQTSWSYRICKYNAYMHYKQQHAGKWVAVKKDKVIAMSKDFAPLQKKIAIRKDAASIRFSLVPKGMITGILWDFLMLNTTWEKAEWSVVQLCQSPFNMVAWPFP